MVMERKYDLVVLLILIVSAPRATEASVVNTAPNVRGWRGEDIRLRCDFPEKPFAVFWVMESTSMSQLQRKMTMARFIDGNFESVEERFDIDKNFSLVITDLTVADEGRYFCQVVLQSFENFENSTFLTISSMPSKHVIEECIGQNQPSQSRCTYQNPFNTPSLNLTCVVSGFNPNVSMVWTEESGKRLNSVISEQTTLSDDTYERVETITVSATHRTEQTFRCIATGEALNGTSTAEITMMPVTRGSRGSLSLIIGLVIGVLALTIIFLLVGKFLQRYHPEFLPQKGCGWNPCWRRPHQPRRFKEEEQFMLKPSSSSLSLTEKQVQQCKEELKANYRLSRRKITVDPLNFMERVELDEIYTNLSLLDKSSMRSTPLTYDDLLSSDENGNLSKRLLVQGEGGAGKTTLCAKIAWDWCQGRILQDLDMVLVIPLRDVTDFKSIGGIVKKYLSDSNAAMTNQIDNYISKNLNKILLIFDGFDEFKGKFSEKNSSEVIRILGCEQYKSCKVIVTTRPWRTNEFRMEKSLDETYTFITVEGFDKENLSTYIRRYFRIREKDALAENLLSFMEENDVIRSNMAPFPIYCAMLCLMWNDFSEDRRKEMQKLKTFSKIFGEMISFLKEHYASKICEKLHIHNAVAHLKEADRAIQDISEIALNGLFDSNLSFPEEQFSECRNAMETCCRVGVLTIERDVISMKRRRDVNVPSFVKSTVSFPHKLFQEYVAGLYMADVYANDAAEYDQLKNKLLPRFEEFRYLFYFSSASGNELGPDIINGMINCASNNITSYSLLPGERKIRDFCVDVAFECHTEEAIRAVGKRWEKYKLSSSMSEHTKAGVVFMVYCNQVLSLSIDDMDCGRSMSRDLAEGMCSSSVLREVSIRLSRFHTDFFKILGEKASNCQIQCLELTLGSWDGDSQHQGDLAQWVCTLPSLSSFSVDCYYLLDDFFSTAADLVGSSQIQDLTLYSRDDSQRLSSNGGALAQWVYTMPSLSSFCVNCKSFPDDFFSTATNMAQSCQIRALHVLFYSGWVSEPASAVTFAQFLCRLPHLEHAELKCDNLPDIFFTTIASQSTSCKFVDECLSDDDDEEPPPNAGLPQIRTSAVDTAPSVRGWKGENIRLRCDIQEEPIAVFWVMENMSQQQKTTKAEYFDGKVESVDERFDIGKNFSLVIADLTVADEGTYNCQVVLRSLENFEHSTFLTISCK
ncbi:uncharacterized protein [Diadema setosum]|uniref:uncharacterized protein n=1 Tax=Diadema setosum TaxID=31175 RepID=UPI003B3A547A